MIIHLQSKKPKVEAALTALRATVSENVCEAAEVPEEQAGK